MADNHVTVKMPQLPDIGRDVDPNDTLFVWDAQEMKLKKCNVSALPFGSGGGSGGTIFSSPFKVINPSANMTITEAPAGVFNTLISDVRLLGKSNYPVNSTQLNNAAFRDDEIEYMPATAKVLIKNFVLNVGEAIFLYPDGTQGGGSGGGDFENLLGRVVLLEQMMAPFLPTVNGANGGRVLFNKPLKDIPIGWAEDTDFRGVFPLGIDTRDNQQLIGKTGGTNNLSLSEANLPAHQHYMFAESISVPIEGENYGINTSPDSPVAFASFQNTQSGYTMAIATSSFANSGLTSSSGNANPTSVDITNPYRIVVWIKFVGV